MTTSSVRSRMTGVVATVDGTKVVDKWSPTSFSETILWGVDVEAADRGSETVQA